jgi:hypothetical protein
MIGFAISLLFRALALSSRLIVFLVLAAARLGVTLVAVLFALAGSATRLLFWLLAKPGETASTRQALDPEMRWAVFRRDGYACLYCGSESNLSIDHVFPVSRGGDNHPDNLQTLCRDCNSRKGALV